MGRGSRRGREQEGKGRKGGRKEKDMWGKRKGEEEQKLECFYLNIRVKNGHNKLMKNEFVFTEIQKPLQERLRHEMKKVDGMNKLFTNT